MCKIDDDNVKDIYMYKGASPIVTLPGFQPSTNLAMQVLVVQAGYIRSFSSLLLNFKKLHTIHKNNVYNLCWFTSTIQA